MENKKEIVKALQNTLRLTRGLSHLELEYREGFKAECGKYYSECVIIRDMCRYIDGYHVAVVGIVNVACDSGVALVRDVLKALYFG